MIEEYSQDEIYTIVRDIYNSTIFSDIVRRNQVRKIDQLERVVKYTFNNVGNIFSAKSIQPSTVATNLENAVYLELCRRGYGVQIGKTTYGEIDFDFAGGNYDGIKTMHIADFLLAPDF